MEFAFALIIFWKAGYAGGLATINVTNLDVCKKTAIELTKQDNTFNRVYLTCVDKRTGKVYKIK